MITKQPIQVKWHGRTRKHYEALGYEYTKKDLEFYVCASELSEGSNKVVEYLCDYCGAANNKRFDSLMSARSSIPKDSCKTCAPKKHYEILLTKGSLESEYPDVADEWCLIRNKLSPDKVTPYSKKIGSWVCKEGHRWKASVYSRTNASSGCPKCASSVGENQVASSLYVLDLPYRREFSFEDLIGAGGGLLRFDFAIMQENGNVKALIEYDGPFHFAKQFKDDGHELLVVHDRMKDDYCKEHSIPLLRIPFGRESEVFTIVKRFVGGLPGVGA